VIESQNLRKILAQNIRMARTSLHITQAKLAEFADISVPYMVDIEYCKTWVSDKTLTSLAKALNMEAYELLIPEKFEKTGHSGGKNQVLPAIADVVKAKKTILRQNLGQIMDDLLLEIIKIYGE
jgi:transcriptional regulator with XRE-family HTH domain